MKTAIITGASGAIGSAAAELFSSNGYNVVINYFKNEKSAKALEKKILSCGGSAFAIKADVSDKTMVDNMVFNAISRFGSVDVLINNAGISMQKMLCDVEECEWDKIFDINVKGVFNCCKAVMPHMIDKKSGKIINVSSVWGVVGGSCEVAYSASKAAVIGFSKALAKELGPSNIQVNCVSPGMIDTKMNSHLSCRDILDFENDTPLMRSGNPDEVASLMLYLAGDNASFITGENININGGYAM